MSAYFNLTLSAQVKAMEPLGESLPNQEIFRRLARAMGYTEPELFETDAEILGALLDSAGIAGGFAALAQAGTIELWPEPLIQFADLQVPDPERQDRDRLGQGRGRRPSAHAAAARRSAAGRGRLRLLSPATSWLMNSSYGNDPRIGEKIGADDRAAASRRCRRARHRRRRQRRAQQRDGTADHERRASRR